MVERLYRRVVCFRAGFIAKEEVEEHMRPQPWRPFVEPSPAEAAVMRRVRRAKLFVFLRERRHEIFDEGFQEELGALYGDSRLGHPPVPPAKLALATILQAYTGASDEEAIEATVMDRRWQLVLDCLDAEEPPFSKSTLVAFRKRLIEHEMDRHLVERTVEVAARRRSFGHKALRAALDSSALWGAGKVEDTYNLLGHALKKALGVIAGRQGRGLAEVAKAAGAPVLTEAGSLKAALDLDWDEIRASGERRWYVCWRRWRAWKRTWTAFPARTSSNRRPSGSQDGCASRMSYSQKKGARGRRCCAAGWRASGWCRWRIPRCATAARARACVSRATSATSCAIWTRDWSERWE